MNDKKILIAYFSREGMNYVNGSIIPLKVGNTEVCAKAIASVTGGDLFKIVPVQLYPVGYEECTDVAQKELRAGSRPGVAGAVADMDSYDNIFIGYPNWWGTMPMPVFTFLESYDFSGKRIAPFCTHEGSGLGRSARDIAAACPGSKVLKGLAIQGGAVGRAEADIRRWIGDLAI